MHTVKDVSTCERSHYLAPPSPSNKSPPSIKILLKPCLFHGADHPTISIRVFSNESALRIRWPNYWSFSFNISPANEHSGLISFRMDWLDLLTVQGTLKSLLHSSKASILWCSAFLTVQLSHPYMTTGKTIALTRQTFVDKVMSLLFNMLSRLVIECSLVAQMVKSLKDGTLHWNHTIHLLHQFFSTFPSWSSFFLLHDKHFQLIHHGKTNLKTGHGVSVSSIAIEFSNFFRGGVGPENWSH